MSYIYEKEIIMNIIGKKGRITRMLSVLMAVCMVIIILPVGMTAHAASYNVWVGGTRVTSSNASSLLGGKASYSADSNTLTLNGASITKGYKVYDTSAVAAVYASGNLNIKLKGSSTVEVSGYAIAVDGNLSISGSGSLTAKTKGDYYSSVYSGGTTKISAGTLNLTATGTEANGLWAYNGLTVTDGKITAKAVGDGANGVCVDGPFAFSAGTLKASAEGAGSFGLAVNNSAKITGGSVSASAKGREAFGLTAADGLTVNAAQLTVETSGDYTTGIYASSFTLTDADLSAYGSESAVYLDSASIKLSGKATYREGPSSPGTVVSSLTDITNTKGLQTKPFVQINSGRDVIRLGGSNRYETARLITTEGWDAAENVVLANGGNFADALSGVPLAYALNAPVMLVDGKTIDSATMSKLSSLGTKNVYLLGGEGVITRECVTQLKDKGFSVERIAGENRYGTAVAIAKKLADVTGKPITDAFFAYGYNYPDALAASSVAAIKGRPILYAPNNGGLDSLTKEYIKSLDLKSAVALGGEAIISKEAYSEIKSSADSASRLYGANRYETAVKIIEKYSSAFTGSGIAFATGTNYPDALAGAALAAKEKIAVLLVPSTFIGDQQAQLKSVITADTNPIYVFGATGAVPDEIVQGLSK